MNATETMDLDTAVRILALEAPAAAKHGPSLLGRAALVALEYLPPLGLPAVLSSVTDVARVCEAAGLIVTVDAYEDPAAGIGDDLFVRVEPSVSGDRLSTVTVHRQGADDGQEVATLYPGSPTLLLWSAICAARGEA